MLVITFILFFLATCSMNSFSQKIVENYALLKKDSLRVGPGHDDFMPYIQKGYTLMLPEQKDIKGVLIFLEDSGYDQKNNNSKQMYQQASNIGFAILSVSTEIPFDFYFSKNSMLSTHDMIRQVFTQYNLPNEDIFLLGGSLVGHRAMRYIKFVKESNREFQLNLKGIVICNFTLDWTRKWYQHERDIRINLINLWEPKFINYMLESHLSGTPKMSPESYHNFSTYSLYDEKNRNIEIYKNYAVRAYIKPDIKFRLMKYLRTLYENNATDIVGFLAELNLLGNENTELIVLESEDNLMQKVSAQTTWNNLDKDDLMGWIQKQVEE